ncbi:hypothetical protein [Streptomyces sp. NPDC047061]|uniref:hypothetical protein n=1 Tax=Streptomyces sp. NPDC047061 TaxID=3154605 RepID=UPI0033FDB389
MEPAGDHRADRATHRQLRRTPRGFTVRRARPDQRLDQPLRARGDAGNIGDRPRLEPVGCPLALIEGARPRNGRGAGQRTLAPPPPVGPGGRAGAPRPQPRRRRSAGVTADRPDGRPALLVSVFIAKDESARPEGAARAR